MEIYMDNAATTRVYDEVIDLVGKVMQSDYGNPSSLHLKGVEAEKYIRYAKETFAKLLKVDTKELIFTSCGTESNNTALIGGAMANMRAGKHIITTRIEHASVYQPMMYLENMGFEVTWLPVNKQGIVDLDALREAVRPDTILVSVMCVNNEIGTIQPIENIVEIVKACNPNTLIHVDAIQGFGKMVLHPKKIGIDMLSISGHKFHGPKGTGVLWVRDRVKVQPMILGGGQQKAMRSGTENVPGIAGMAKAAELEYTGFEDKLSYLYGLRSYFIEEIEKLDGTYINGGRSRGSLRLQEDALACAAPHIVSVSFDDIRAEVLLHALEEAGVYVSSGSACSSNHPAISGTLKAIAVEKQYLDATLRFSFSFDTTKEEIDGCISALAQLLPMLRRYTPGGRKKGGRRV
jgi:cysteine desulfurase